MSRSLGGPAPRTTRSTTSALGDGWLTGGENIPHRRCGRKRHGARTAFDPSYRGEYDRRMLSEALGAGLELVGGWLDCGRTVARRIGAQVADPLARLAGWGPAPDAATGDPPPADQPDPAEAAPQSQVEEAKYYLGPPREPAAGYADRESGELPRAYGSDRIVLLPRDPWWVFSYWEITPATRVHALRALAAEAEGARELLRVYDVTFITFTGDNAWQSFDVGLPPGADHWYLNVGRPAASFCVEIGLATPGGRFLPLARSNVVTTSRATPSPDATVRWVDVAPGAVRESARAWEGTPLARAAAEEQAAAEIGEGRSRSSEAHTPRTAR